MSEKLTKVIIKQSFYNDYLLLRVRIFNISFQNAAAEGELRGFSSALHE